MASRPSMMPGAPPAFNRVTEKLDGRIGVELHHDGDRQITGRSTVLNVEDFEPSRFLRTHALEAAQFEVVEADSASEAVAIVADKVPDLALLDVDLPDGDGFQLCASLRKSHPSLPVLLISAVHLAAWARDVGVDVGASGYLREPVDSRALVGRVRLALGGIKDEPSVTWVVTDVFGAIRQASAAAAHMLNLSARAVSGRSLLLFFVSDRHDWAAALHHAAQGALVQREGAIRPRNRCRVDVDVELARVRDWNPADPALIWFFRAPGHFNL